MLTFRHSSTDSHFSSDRGSKADLLYTRCRGRGLVILGGMAQVRVKESVEGTLYETCGEEDGCLQKHQPRLVCCLRKISSSRSRSFWERR